MHAITCTCLATSRTGCSVPTSLLLCMMVTSAVLSVSASRTSVGDTRPFFSQMTAQSGRRQVMQDAGYVDE
jgi:hypothetical protein